MLQIRRVGGKPALEVLARAIALVLRGPEEVWPAIVGRISGSRLPIEQHQLERVVRDRPLERYVAASGSGLETVGKSSTTTVRSSIGGTTAEICRLLALHGRELSGQPPRQRGSNDLILGLEIL